MNIRRNVLMIVYVLSVSMILSGCDSEGGHTANEQEDLYMSDVNEVVVNEEEKTVEPRNMTLLNTRITEPDESMFKAKLDNGKYVRMSFRSYDNATINIKIEVNDATYRVVKLNANNKGEVVLYTISKTSNFRFVYEPTNTKNIVLDVIVRQYEVQP